MKVFIRGALLIATLLVSSLSSAAALTMMSWNTMRLGQGAEKSFPALAEIGGKADLIALQEVMNEEGLAKLEAELEKQTGEQWSTIVSHAVGSRSYKELYAFLMRDSVVVYEDGAVVYLDRGDYFIREPFSARFKSKRDGTLFTVASIHVLYGKGSQDREPEIRELESYWAWLESIYPNTPVMLVGDFNTPPSQPAFSGLSQHATPLITKGATTLSAREGLYANLYDNIWVSKALRLKLGTAGIMDYPRMIGWSHEKSRKHVSDHAPVFVTLGNAKLRPGVVAVQPEAEMSRVVGEMKQKQITPFKAQKTTATIASNVGDGGNIRGNANSRIFHWPSCPSYNKVSLKNRVEFSSVQDAVSAGYRLAGNCSK